MRRINQCIVLLLFSFIMNPPPPPSCCSCAAAPRSSGVHPLPLRPLQRRRMWPPPPSNLWPVHPHPIGVFFLMISPVHLSRDRSVKQPTRVSRVVPTNALYHDHHHHPSSTLKKWKQIAKNMCEESSATGEMAPSCLLPISREMPDHVIFRIV